MAAYMPPDWGVDGANAFGIYVEVIKSGVVVENMTLPTDPCKSCVVAGRMEPLCDLVLEHPSVSRVHAALQFDKQGALFLRDLESTHGTFLNKKRIPANDFVRLHIGDVVVFGESTRLYAVCGPPELLPQEYDSLNLQKFREKSEQRQEKKAVQRKSSGRSGGRREDDDSGASWGFGEDAAEEDEDVDEENNQEAHKDKDNLPDYLRNLKEDETPYKSSLKQNEINDKDQKLFQQLQTRIKKMENLKLEKSRIQAKQNQLTGLTEGQEKTLERNEQRIQVLKKEIDDIEERIHVKNAQREKTKSGASATAGAGVGVKKKQSVNEVLYGYESDEDDFYDRTKSNQRKLLERKQQHGVVAGEPTLSATSAAIGGAKKNQREVLTAESIQAKIKTLERELSELATEYEEEQARASRDVVQEQKQVDEELDPLDSFMASTTRELHSTQLSSIQMRKEQLETELRRQRQLLVVATPALAHVPAQVPRAESKPEPKSSERRHVVESPRPSQPQKHYEVEKETGVLKAEQPEMIVKSPAVPTKRPADPREPEHADETDESTSKEKKASLSIPKSEKSRSDTAATRTEAPPTNAESGQTKKRRVVGPAALGPARPPVVAAKRKDDMTGFGNEASTLEGGDSVWVPPANQSGDGRTKLNDKYGY